MLSRALPASGQIAMREADGWRSLGRRPSGGTIDLAARTITVAAPGTLTATANTPRDGTLVWLYPYRAHVIACVVDDEGVLIVRVLHGRQDWERCL